MRTVLRVGKPLVLLFYSTVRTFCNVFMGRTLRFDQYKNQKSINVTTCLRHVDWLGSTAAGPEYPHAADEEGADRRSSQIQTLG